VAAASLTLQTQTVIEGLSNRLKSGQDSGARRENLREFEVYNPGAILFADAAREDCDTISGAVLNRSSALESRHDRIPGSGDGEGDEASPLRLPDLHSWDKSKLDRIKDIDRSGAESGARDNLADEGVDVRSVDPSWNDITVEVSQFTSEEWGAALDMAIVADERGSGMSVHPSSRLDRHDVFEPDDGEVGRVLSMGLSAQLNQFESLRAQCGANLALSLLPIRRRARMVLGGVRAAQHLADSADMLKFTGRVGARCSTRFQYRGLDLGLKWPITHNRRPEERRRKPEGASKRLIESPTILRGEAAAVERGIVPRDEGETELAEKRRRVTRIGIECRVFGEHLCSGGAHEGLLKSSSLKVADFAEIVK
jgi:hypothetical protein